MKSLISSVETEFLSLFPSEESGDIQGVTATPSLVAPFRGLVYAFRTVDAVSPTFCSAVHVAASRVLCAWAANLTEKGITTMGRYTAVAPSALRSCAVDVFVALCIMCKVRPLMCPVVLSALCLHTPSLPASVCIATRADRLPAPSCG